MALTHSNAPKLGSIAPEFSLPGVDGKTYSLRSFSQSKVLVVVFFCNHCPYAVAVQKRINDLARAYCARGLALVAINPNDSSRYPDDSFESMKVRAREEGFVFPYLQDESQSVARDYLAVCTPDFFVFKNTGEFVLKYAGRLDDNWKDETRVKKRELASAVDAILMGKEPSSEQTPSMGCSIKWKLT